MQVETALEEELRVLHLDQWVAGKDVSFCDLKDGL